MIQKQAISSLFVGIDRVVYRISDMRSFCRHEYAQEDQANAA